jgi:hypothetical protein
VPLKLPAVVSNVSGTPRECCVGEGEERVCWGRGQHGRPYRILFYSNELNFRGTSVGLYNYARYFEELACGESYIATKYCASSLQALPKFEARFPGRVVFVPTPPKKAEEQRQQQQQQQQQQQPPPPQDDVAAALVAQAAAAAAAASEPPCENPAPAGVEPDHINSVLQSFVLSAGIDAIFTLQSNTDLPPYLRVKPPTKYLVQGVFFATSPPDPELEDRVRYVALSEDIDRRENIPIVPRIVDFAIPLAAANSSSGGGVGAGAGAADASAADPSGDDYMRASAALFRAGRAELGIPESTRVFCRHGGEDTFDIQWVRDALCKVAAADVRNTVFVFMNTDPFNCYDAASLPLPNVVFIPGTSDLAAKQRFIASCDACLHARMDGETFGNSVAECAMFGKPVLVYADPVHKYHLRALRGEWAASGTLPEWASHGIIYRGYMDVLSLMQSMDLYKYRGDARFAETMRGLYVRFTPANVMLDFLHHFGVLNDVIRASVGGTA